MGRYIAKRTKYCLIIVLILQVILTIYFGMQKSGYHLDEIYTYTLSNYEGGFVTSTEGVLEGWKSGEFYKEVLEVSEEEAFSYNIPYQNQIGDVHPPLYYFVIHTLSSLASGTFSKWIGISANILCNILTTCVLFWVSKKICKDDNLAIISTAVWALSNGAIEAGIFIRMYAMLTFFTVSLVGLHIKGFEELREKERFSVTTTIMILVCTTQGILTQYYYMIFCFFFCGSFVLYLFYTKRWKNLIHYVVTEISALIISVTCFPSMLKHIFGGYRGKQAFQSVLEIQGYGSILKSVASMISKDLFNGLGEEIVILLLVVFGIVVIKKSIKRKKIDISDNHLILITLAVVSICYILTIAKIAPYQANRYYMCIYPLLVIIIVFGVYYLLCIKKNIYKLYIVGAIFSVIVGSSYLNQDMDYLYLDCAIRQEQLKPYEGMPVIVLNGIYNGGPDNWLYEYGNYDAVYRCEGDGELQGLNNAAASYNLSKGFLVYAHGMPESDEELLERVKGYIDVESFEKITDIGCRVFFCTLDNEQNF